MMLLVLTFIQQLILRKESVYTLGIFNIHLYQKSSFASILLQKLQNVAFELVFNEPVCSVARIIDQFARKRCQKKRKDVGYKLLLEFFQKYFVVHQQSAVENSFSKYV